MKLVDAIEARVEAATPGPLEVRPAKLSGIKTKYLDVDISREEAWDEWVTLPPSDALLFAYASTDIEVLLRVVRAAKEWPCLPRWVRGGPKFKNSKKSSPSSMRR